MNPEASMRRALRLAARGFTHPNPMVGCVLVRGGRIVGEGFHRLAGEPHAEVMAIRAAGDHAGGSTAYVNLEPCSHFGRTPPCVNALIEARVEKVVAACVDPNPRVAGQGLAALRAAGIEVENGLLEAEARRLNRVFFHFHATGLPWVTLKSAVTLDGKTATKTGDSRWITAEKSRALVHKLRAEHGAVLVGIGTVLADDPLLTARFRGAPRQPDRIVLDSMLRIPLDSQLVRTAREVPLRVFCSPSADCGRHQALESAGVQVVRAPMDASGRLSLSRVLSELAATEITSVLVEGGGSVHASFIESSFVNRILWFIAPKIAGGVDASTSVEGVGFDRMADAMQLRFQAIKKIGPDILLDAEPILQKE